MVPDSPKHVDGARQESPVRALAVCACADCADRSHSGWLALQASREKFAARGVSVAPLAREDYRGGRGDDCPACGGQGHLDCERCGGVGCSSCYGRGYELEDCERCEGSGLTQLQRCALCGHLVEFRDLNPAEGRWVWECEDCGPCEACGQHVHEDVAVGGLCLDCQVSESRWPAGSSHLAEKAGGGAHDPTPPAASSPNLAGTAPVTEPSGAGLGLLSRTHSPAASLSPKLLPERAAALLHDERGTESTENAILVACLVVGALLFTGVVGLLVKTSLDRLHSETAGPVVVVERSGR